MELYFQRERPFQLQSSALICVLTGNKITIFWIPSILMLKGMLCFQSNSNFRLSKGIHPPFVRNQFVLLLQQPLTRVLLYFVILQQNLHYRGGKLLHAVRSCSSLAICAAQHTVPQPGYSLHLLYSTTIAHLRERLLQMPSKQGFVLNLQIGILFYFFSFIFYLANQSLGPILNN